MSRFVDNSAQIIGRVRAAVAEARVETTEEIGNSAQASAPVRTGALRDSKSTDHSMENASVVGFKAAYAVHVELGTSNTPGRHYLTKATKHGKRIFGEKLKEKLK